MADQIKAQHDDRLDLISRREYPDVDISDAIRTLVWANPGVSTRIGLGTPINTPPITPAQYAASYSPLVRVQVQV